MSDTVQRRTPAHAAPAEDTTVYCGHYPDGAGPGDVWLEDGTGGMVGVLTHRTEPPSHSPTGFSWGGAGSGCAELARAMLLDALGEAARCPLCAGAGQVTFLPGAALDADPVPYDPAVHNTVQMRAQGVEALRCWDCDGDGTTRVPYQDFKFQVIAQLPQDDGFTLTRTEVREWYARHQAKVAGSA